MQTLTTWLKNCFSPQTRLGRKGFAMFFICAIISIFVLELIAEQLWLIFYDSYPYWKFSLELSILCLWAELAFIIGFWPFSVYLLFCYTEITFKEGINVFSLEMIVIDFLYILYLTQCIRRCQDMGVKWFCCLIPFYNPFALLFKKSIKKQK